MGKRVIFALTLSFLLVAGSVFAADESRLMRLPDIHGDMIVFSYAGDLWTAPASGGTATRLTTHIGGEAFAKFSPDGKTVAFSASYDGNFDVFTIPARGGVPKRLTWHPKADMVLDWHPSGKKVLFRSNKDARTNPGPRYDRLYTIDSNGGYPEVLPLFEGELTSYSPDGDKIAYNRIAREFRTWKRYRGGMEQNIWTYDFKKNKAEKLTDYEGTDAFPMWYGDVVYFISDRDYTMNIFCYDLHTKQVHKVTDHSEYDVKWPSLGDDRIIYENAGYLYVLDLKTEKTTRLTINVPSEHNLKREAYINAGTLINSFDLSSTGKRAVFGARGDIFTVPAKKGEVRNLTKTPGIRERSPAFSPDGNWVAYFSDRTGEYELYLTKPDGTGEEEQITKIGKNFPLAMLWSPDSKHIAFYDQLGWLYRLDVESKKITKIDRNEYGDLRDFAWSADSKWITYSKTGDNNFSSIYLYNLAKDEKSQATSDLYNDYSPSFDPDGKYLYFLTDRTINIQFRNFESGWEFVSPTTVCVTTLKADTPSPLAPESDEIEVKEEEKENGDKDKADKDDDKKDEKNDEEKEEDKELEIDIAGLESRTISLPIGSGNFGGLTAVSGKVIYGEFPPNASVISFTDAGAKGGALKYFDLKEREEKTIIAGINEWAISSSGNKILYAGPGGKFGIIDIAAGKNIGDGSLNTTLMVKTDPAAEWRQIFYEAWRLERDFFYVENMHGIDWKKIRKRYEVFLPYLSSRGDLNYVLGELQGELNVGHAYIGGGMAPGPRNPFMGGGYLGCDFEIDKKSKLYRFSKIYTGRNWDGRFQAPLTQAGIDVAEGDYLLEINGRELVYPTNVHELLENTAGHQIVIKVGKDASDEDAKEYTIEPLRNDTNLRYADWIESNRQKVLKASGGKIGYLHVPDTAVNGLMEFGKYFYPQAGMDGIVVDVRYNSGGWIPNFFINKLGQKMTNTFKRRDRKPLEIPPTAVKGHLACIINGYAGSGGDAFPYYFKQAGLGPLVGMKTWGGLVGYDRSIPLLDGGRISMPSIGFINMDGEWDVERIGVAPDIEVDNRPDLVIDGHDPQLEKAVEYLMEQIKKDPPSKKYPSTPKDPDRS
ncbi:MAG: PD40 domain-containing protein [Candidatus Krumholzibacteria bacterium]|nr:PD40 domain-containing protein [Candidatus Krumholzibacteria bacterium]